MRALYGLRAELLEVAGVEPAASDALMAFSAALTRPASAQPGTTA